MTRRKTGQHASSATDLCVFNNQKECSQKSYQILCLNFLKFLKEGWFVSFAGQKQIRNMRCHQNDVIDDVSGKRRNDRKCRLILGPPDVLIFSFIRISSFFTSCKKIYCILSRTMVKCLLMCAINFKDFDLVFVYMIYEITR